MPDMYKTNEPDFFRPYWTLTLVNNNGLMVSTKVSVSDHMDAALGAALGEQLRMIANYYPSGSRNPLQYVGV